MVREANIVILSVSEGPKMLISRSCWHFRFFADAQNDSSNRLLNLLPATFWAVSQG